MNENSLLAAAVLAAPETGDAPFTRSEAVEILEAADAPLRLTAAGLLAVLGVDDDRDAPDVPGPAGDTRELAGRLARALYERRDPDLPTDSVEPEVAVGRIVDVFHGLAVEAFEWETPIELGSTEPPEQSSDGDGSGPTITSDLASLSGQSPVQVLAAVVGPGTAGAITPVGCVTEFGQDPAGRPTLTVTGDVTYTGTVAAVATAIQPWNWPLCNAQFAGMDVIDGSFAASVAAQQKDGCIRRAFDVTYRETVLLPGTVAGTFWSMIDVVTNLDCHQWRDERTDAGGAVALHEVGMSYTLAPGGDGIVMLDEGEAKVTEAGPGLVRVTSSKTIAFVDPAALSGFSAKWCREVFCILWNHLFDITVADCTHRLSPAQAETAVREASDHPGPDRITRRRPPSKATTSKSGAPGAGGSPMGPWLGDWLEDAADYWSRSVALMAREFDRLEQRRTSSQPVTTQAMFYDALETWEANRLSLREGLDLSVRFLEGSVRGGFVPVDADADGDQGGPP